MDEGSMKRKPPSTSAEFVEVLRQLFDAALPQTLEEADEELRAAGLDPDAVGMRSEALASRLLNDLVAEQRTRAKEERDRFRAELESEQAEEVMTLDQMRAEIAALRDQAAKSGGHAGVAALFHKIEGQASESDLKSLLAELRFLKKKRERGE